VACLDAHSNGRCGWPEGNGEILVPAAVDREKQPKFKPAVGQESRQRTCSPVLCRVSGAKEVDRQLQE
jgi:hypothetical protein